MFTCFWWKIQITLNSWYILKQQTLTRSWEANTTFNDIVELLPREFYGPMVVFVSFHIIPDSKIQGANKGPIWGPQDPGGPHVGPMNLDICNTTPLCMRIWWYLSSKILSGNILSSVCLRLSQFSQLYFMQYMGLCVFRLPISLTMIVRTYVLCLVTIIKSEVWPVCHGLKLGHETRVCAVCLYIFLRHLSDRKYQVGCDSFITDTADSHTFTRDCHYV